ncbi:hypothetical protein J4E85_008302 [Alternaria conjuncta]|uniref:uncharacterized protein n=1 Tax=Alternaria conjuncta TaxID=181017 RepID=UPI00221EA36F|nr:uncharacterized protein J4E85_008302 [Alternaria conjuncta]KAI4924142.1 hypothetical protein J4E85_008302 [Alternaria conjuncta]
MKFFTLALATLLAQTVTIAQSLWWNQQSSGFRLILKSTDNDLNDTFYHNVSSYNYDNQGILNWPLSLWGRDDPASSAMRFHYEAGTNLVEIMLEPWTDIYQLVWFEEDSASMYIAIDEDDTGKVRDWVVPPKQVKNWST